MLPTWMDRIALDSMLRPFVGHGFRYLHHSTFGRGVRSDVLPSNEGDDAGNIDHLACSSFSVTCKRLRLRRTWSFVCKELLRELLTRHHRCFDVDIDDSVDIFVGEVNSFGSPLNAGTVQHDVRCQTICPDLLVGLADRLELRYIALVFVVLAAATLDDFASVVAPGIVL